MVVGSCRIVLSIPGNDSLKGKRKVVRRILDRLRHKFNAAAAEVDDMDVHQRAVIGLAVVSNDRRHASSMLDTLTAFVAGASEARIVDRRMEILNMGDGEHMPSAPLDFDAAPWSDDGD